MNTIENRVRCLELALKDALTARAWALDQGDTASVEQADERLREMLWEHETLTIFDLPLAA